MDENQKNAADLSPCVGICALTPDAICIGCGRTNNEVRYWLNMTQEQRLEVLQQSQSRLKDLKG